MTAKDRYSCQVQLPGFGDLSQNKLKQAKVLIVGVGGLGCPAAQYLCRAGVGQLAVADFDTVSLSNLHRQILFNEDDVGRLKTDAAIDALANQNPDTSLRSIPTKLTNSNVVDLVSDYDVVLDCCDNFEAKTILNDGCVIAGVPLVYGAAFQFEGQVAVWNVDNGDGTRSPHYRDIFSDTESQSAADCSVGGVMPTLTGIIGCLQANEAIKYLSDQPGLLASQLMVFNVIDLQSYTTKLPAASWTVVSQLKDDLPEISVEDLRDAMTGQQYQLIDVRTTKEHNEFNIGGRSVPLADILADDVKLDSSKPTVLYCLSGQRSKTALRHLAAKMPELKARSLAGGLVAWQELE